MKSVHIPAYYLFPLVTYILIMITVSFKFYQLNTANFYQTQFKHDILLFGLLQAFDLLSIALVHLILYYCLCYPQNKYLKQKKLPTIILNLPFLLFYFFNVLIAFYDTENYREMESDISVDNLKAYTFGIRQKYDLNYVFKGIKGGSGGIKVFIDVVLANPIHWVLLVSSYLVVLIGCIIWLCFNFRIFLSQFFVEKADNQIQNEVSEELLEPVKKKKEVQVKIIQFQNPVANWFVMIQIIVLLIDVTIFGVSITSNATDSINKYTPSAWVLYRSASPEHLSNLEFDLAFEQFKAELPADRYLLDQRNPPLYPLVTGTYEQFCAYNQQLCPQEKQLFLSKYLQVESPPNILFIAFESFSPSPKYIEQSFVDNKNDSEIVLGSPYSAQDLPNIRKYSEKGANFLGMSSFGLPTINGWHSLFTSEKPKFKGINMVSHDGNEFESFMKKFRHLGYFTTYVSPSPLDFDGKSNWMFNGMADEVYFNIPSEEQCRWLNINKTAKNAWIADRVTSRQAILAATVQFINNGKLTLDSASAIYGEEVNVSQQQALDILTEVLSVVSTIAQPNQPLQLVYMNVDSHTPFTGYDYPEMYDAFRTDDPYQTMIRSADHHMGRLIDYVMKIDPNTILALTGDHGAREHPLYNANQNVTNFTRFDSRCVGQNMGNDNLFDTSGFIYHPTIEAKNLTLTTATDHDDFIFTLEAMVYKAWGQPQSPTSRLGVDLVQVLKSGNTTALKKKTSVSTTHTIIEIRSGDSILRSSIFGAESGFVVQATYPTCILKQSQQSDLYEKGILRARFLAYLAQENRVWSDVFLQNCTLNVDLMDGNSCTLERVSAQKTQPVDNLLVIIFTTIFSGGFIVACILGYLASRCSQLKSK